MKHEGGGLSCRGSAGARPARTGVHLQFQLQLQFQFQLQFQSRRPSPDGGGGARGACQICTLTPT
ncbi:hypothetical protein WME73_46240 [Sorangium sp. So ce302]|uniref:hypothetical protein n=1 Tax=Sorangium sp. So ce302 TaxID=3133297 RepID=UPI003F617448